MSDIRDLAMKLYKGIAEGTPFRWGKTDMGGRASFGNRLAHGALSWPGPGWGAFDDANAGRVTDAPKGGQPENWHQFEGTWLPPKGSSLKW